MKCPKCGAAITEKDRKCPKCKTLLPAAQQQMKVNELPTGEGVQAYAFKASHIAMIAGALLLVNWFLTPWQSTALHGGFGYFLANLGEYSLSGIRTAFATNSFLGFTFTVATVLFYLLWLIPVAGGLTLLAFLKDRRLIRLVAIFAWVAFGCTLGFTFFRFWYHAQIEVLITPSSFSWGYYVSLVLLLWIAFATSSDFKSTEKEI